MAGAKRKMKDVMADFKAAPNEEKRELGKLINESNNRSNSA